MTARTWIAVAFAAASAGVAQGFGRFTLGVVLPAMRDDLGLSNTVAGSLATANVTAYLIGTLAVAIASSRITLLTIMRVGLLIAVGGQVLSAFAPGVVVLAFGMFCSGFGGAWVWIPTPVVASAAFPPEKRGTAIGLLSSGMALSIVFTSQLAGWVRRLWGDEGWRNVYVVQAALGLLIAVGTIAVVRHAQEQLSEKGSIGGFDALRRVPGWKPVTAMYTTFGFMYLLVLAFMSSRLEDDNGWSASTASLSFTLIGLGMVVGGPIIAKSVAVYGTRATLATAFALWSTLVVLILPGWVVPTLAASVVIGMIFASIPVTLTMYFVQNASPEDYGPGFSAATLAFGVAQMISPQIGGALADWTSTFLWVLILSAGCALLGILGALSLPRRSAAPSVPPVPDVEPAATRPLAAPSVFSVKPH
ncbi:MAG: MFS transporter [Actinomycetota bacterium]|nr:MFS transporter [Actinomycetota bacterium]